MKIHQIALGELMVEKRSSIDPSKHPDEVFDLYSIPAFDSQIPETLRGVEIGSAKKEVRPGDILLSRIVPHIRRAWVVGSANGNRLIGSGEWMIFNSRHAWPDYLRHVLVSDWFHPKLMQTVSGVGGSLLRARPSEVAKIEIPLPPISEQKRIAAILDKADAIRRKRQQALRLTDDFLRSVFLDMFGDPVTNPKGWEVTTVGDELEFLTSGSRGWAQYYADKGDLFIRIQNLRGGLLDLSDAAYVNAPESAEATRTRVREGDVLLSITADLGRTAVVPPGIGKAHINQHIAILRLSSMNPVFVAQLLASPGGQRQFESLNKSAVKAGLNFDDIRSIKLLNPPLELQTRFAEIVDRIIKNRRRQESAGVEASNAFTSLQQRAFRSEL